MMRRLLIVWALLAILADGACGYRVFGPYASGDNGRYYNKWGDIFAPGSPGGTIAWSLMPDGVTIDSSFSDDRVAGVSNLGAIMNNLGYAESLSAIERVLAKWSAVANIYFVHAPDSGAPLASADAQPPDAGLIRFGAFEIADSAGAYGYAPPPNGGSLEGDVLLNSNNAFYFDPGSEGNPIQVFNDLESLLLHEVGHALGLRHSDACAVMSADFYCYRFVNRELDPDDIAGIQFLYGPALQSDFDRDNYATGADLTIWATSFGLPGAIQLAGDASDDGVTGGDDFLIWQSEFAPSPTGFAAVPEPVGAALAALAVACAALVVRISHAQSAKARGRSDATGARKRR